MFVNLSKIGIIRSNAVCKLRPLQSIYMSTKKDVQAVGNPVTDESTKPLPPSRKLTKSQKYYILLAGKHKSVNDVPDVMPDLQINAMYTRARITVNLICGFLVLLTCLYTVRAGKQAAEKGETLDKMNRDFHRQYAEQNKDK